MHYEASSYVVCMTGMNKFKASKLGSKDHGQVDLCNLSWFNQAH
jgi:hypothetical protein